MVLINDKVIHFETINDNEIEKIYEQVELVNQKGELLLQSSANDSNENQIERLLETINRNYENLSTKNKAHLNNINQINLITITTESSAIDELRHRIDELDLSMNELSELLVSSTTDTISAQPIKLTEQLVDNNVVQNQLEKRKLTLEQLKSSLQTIKKQENTNSIKG